MKENPAAAVIQEEDVGTPNELPKKALSRHDVKCHIGRIKQMKSEIRNRRSAAAVSEEKRQKRKVERKTRKKSRGQNRKK